MPLPPSDQIESFAATEVQRASIESAENCVRLGLHLGIIGIITKIIIFVKISLLCAGRSALPPFKKQTEATGKFKSSVCVALAIVCFFVSLVSGIKLSQARECQDPLFQMMRILNLQFHYVVDLGTIAFATLQVLRIWGGMKLGMLPKLLGTVFSLTFGLSGWMYWIVICTMSYSGVPLPVSYALPLIYWVGVVLFGTAVILAAVWNMDTTLKWKLGHALLAFVCWGGCASAVFAELAGGLAYDTIFKVPSVMFHQGIFGWALSLATAFGQYLAAL